MADSFLLVGLGNPGKTYEKTRHNVGFLVLQELARRYEWSWKSSSLYRSMVAQGQVAGQTGCLMLPQTMMNNSGLAVAKFVRDREVDFRRMLLVCDDFNLDFGELRLRRQGSDGGHNGLKSIIAQLGTGEFGRLRLGIDRPPAGVDAADYVLATFLKAEQKVLPDFIRTAADCCDAWISEGMDKVMNAFNKRKGNE